MEVLGQNRGRGGGILTPNELVFPLVCANKCDRECARRRTHTVRLTDANLFNNLSNVVCYSYGTDNYRVAIIQLGL